MGAAVFYLLMLQNYHFKAKDSQVKNYCVWNISGDFSANNMKKNKKQKQD